MDDHLRATVRRTYPLSGKRVLLLEDTYEGGVEAGDVVEVALSPERTVRVTVDGVAWGSSFTKDNPPLTLIVHWGDEPDPMVGASVRGVKRSTG